MTDKPKVGDSDVVRTTLVEEPAKSPSADQTVPATGSATDTVSTPTPDSRRTLVEHPRSNTTPPAATPPDYAPAVPDGKQPPAKTTTSKKGASAGVRSTLVEQPTVTFAPRSVETAAADSQVRRTIAESSTMQAAHPPTPRQTLVEPPARRAVQSTVDLGPRNAQSPTNESISASDLAPALVYRSLTRPSMAVLTALDDGSTQDGESWRLRRTRTTIGRVSGEIVIPHDPDISGEHAQIVQRSQSEGSQWQLVDLNSTNGTFLRVSGIVLRSGKEILVGSRRFVFSDPGPATGTAAPAGDARQTRRQEGPGLMNLLNLGPRLIEQTADGDDREFPLQHDGGIIGRDPRCCAIAFTDDPFLDPQHARIRKDKRGRWIMDDLNTVNGVWIRVSQVPLDASTEFMIGGQRFRFRVL